MAAATLAALLLAAVAGLSVGTVLLGREQTRTEAARKDAVAATEREHTAAEGEKQAAALAQRDYKLALQTLDTVIFDIQRRLNSVSGAHAVQRDLLATASPRMIPRTPRPHAT